MANTTVRIRRSGSAGNIPNSLTYGELALNYADGKLFYKASNGAIVQYSSATGGGSDSFATINANSSLVLATSPTDTLNIVPGNNITITACTTSKTITINSTGGGNKSTSSSTPPTSPGIGDFWYDTLTDVLYRYTSDGVSNFWFDLSGQSIGGGSSSNVITDMYISGNVTPTTDNVYNLGSATSRWHSLYVGPGSIDIGGVVLSNVGGNLVISGNSDVIVGNVSLTSFTQTTSANLIYQAGIDATQNTNITSALNISEVAFNQSNTSATDILVLKGVNTTQNTNITSALNVASAAFNKANTGIINLSMPGSLTTPFTGTARYYPISTITLNSVYANLSGNPSSNLQFVLLKNGSNIGSSFIINSNSAVMIPVTLPGGVSLTTSDYLTLNLLGSGITASDLSVKITYS